MIDLSAPCVCGSTVAEPNPDCERCALIRTIDALARALAYARGYGPWDAESRRWLREKYGVDYGRETWNGATPITSTQEHTL